MVACLGDKTVAGPEAWLQQHAAFARPILERLAERGGKGKRGDKWRASVAAARAIVADAR
jgi:hypothetical protein